MAIYANTKQITDFQDLLTEARDFANAASMIAAGELMDGPSPPLIACADRAVEKIIEAIEMLRQLRDAEPEEAPHD